VVKVVVTMCQNLVLGKDIGRMIVKDVQFLAATSIFEHFSLSYAQEHVTETSCDSVFQKFQVFEQAHFEEDNGGYSEFRLVGCKCVGAYVRNKRNQNQVSMEFAWK
jgi:hypothetical protein